MMQLLNLIFRGCTGVVGLALFLGVWCLIVWLLCRRTPRSRRALLMAGGVPLYVAILCGLLWHQWRPATVFHDEFGFVPPADVRNLQSESFILGDSGHLDMTFKCTPVTIAKIISAGMAPETTSSPGLATLDLPAWWTSKPPQNAEIYSGVVRQRSFRAEQAVLIYDPVTSMAYYRWQGVD